MKRIFTTALVISLFLLLAASVYAVGVADVDLGTISRNESRSATFKVTNNNNESITLSNVTFTSSNFQVTLDAGQLPKALAVNETFDVKATIVAPKSLASVDSSFLAKVWEETSTVKYTTASNPAEASINNKIKLKVENKIELSDWDITITSRDGSTRTSGKRTNVRNIRPGDLIKLDVEASNKFPNVRDKEVDFNDLRIELEFQGGNNDDFELDENDEFLDLNAGDEDRVVFDIDVEKDAKEGTTPLKLRISGLDTNGALHGEEVTIDFRVEREDHDLQFNEARLTPSTLLCGQGLRTVQVDTQILNIGSRRERNVGVELSVSGLNVFERKVSEDLDEDDDTSFSFSFKVPETAKSGVYEVRLTSVYDTTVKNNEKTLTLAVEECKKEETPQQPPVVVQQPPQQTTNTTPTVIVPTTTTTPSVRVRETSFMDSNTYLVVLAVGATLAFLVLIVLLVAVFKKK